MKRVLLIVNARAGSVSGRTREVIAKALAADFKLEAAETLSRNHATALARDAVDQGFDSVIAFGGDGTINEAAQSLVNTDVALGILPGGSTNVMARSLGVPRNPIEATAFIASRIATSSARTINVGALNDRYFVWGAGMGLDAEVVKRVETNPEAKRRYPEWVFVRNAFQAGVTQYLGADASITVEVPGEPPQRVLLVVCSNGRPFTYFKRFPVDACPRAALSSGLDIYGLTRIRWATVPRLVASVFVTRSHVKWRSGRYHHDVAEAEWSADRPLPVQVDGDYIGEHRQASIRLIERGLKVLV